MSDKTTTTPTAVPTDAEATESSTDVTLVEKQPNPLVRGWHAIKRNPKTTLAVVGGAVLVTVAAAAGRATAGSHVEIVNDDYEPEPILVTGDVVESTDTKTA